MGKIENLGLLFVSTLLGATGQLLFKYGLNNAGTMLIWIAAGLVAYFISTLIYFMVLSRVHLSWAYGIGGMSYIFATILAYTVLMENIPVLRWVGVGVIILGVVLIGWS